MTAPTLHHPVDLEPSLIAPRTYSSRRLQVRLDVAGVISLLIVLLYVLPATLIVPSLTFAGRPALLLALALFAWWLMARLSPQLLMVGPQPLRWACGFYLVSLMLSYMAGLLRGLPSLEANGQNFNVLISVQFIGLVLMAADGIPNWARLRRVLQVFLWSAAFMAVIGLIQSLFEYDVAQHLVVPGLELKSDLADFQMRGANLFRVAGTATHYIEFSTVLAMAVPFGLHFSRFAQTRNTRIMFAALTLIIAAAVPIAISRTGVVALGVAMLIMFIAAWNWRMRYNMLVISIVVIAAMNVLRPGLLGTLKAMFLWVEADPSIEGRTKDYAYIEHWFSQRPWLGRGPGTLIPDLYNIILDNQWAYTLVTCGIIGVVALATLHVTCIVLAIIALRRAATDEDRHLCAALIATQFLAIVVGGTFDSLGFTTFAFTLAALTGLCGAVWRFTHPRRTVRTSTVRRILG
ncbi:O-antigen ligase family protein [Actinoplanes sp. NPDC024001]|uniref:O-antigen ligase family protein n=1 Tax=Actinoplanes sp. NPDC024001 TaxID=3154598 RepID=UPI0033C0CD82